MSSEPLRESKVAWLRFGHIPLVTTRPPILPFSHSLMIKEESIQCVLVWAALRRRRGLGTLFRFCIRQASRTGHGLAHIVTYGVWRSLLQCLASSCCRLDWLFFCGPH